MERRRWVLAIFSSMLLMGCGKADDSENARLRLNRQLVPEATRPLSENAQKQFVQTNEILVSLRARQATVCLRNEAAISELSQLLRQIQESSLSAIERREAIFGALDENQNTILADQRALKTCAQRDDSSWQTWQSLAESMKEILFACLPGASYQRQWSVGLPPPTLNPQRVALSQADEMERRLTSQKCADTITQVAAK